MSSGAPGHSDVRRSRCPRGKIPVIIESLSIVIGGAERNRLVVVEYYRLEGPSTAIRPIRRKRRKRVGGQESKGARKRMR